MHGEVHEVVSLTPRLVRVVLGGDGLGRVPVDAVHRPVRQRVVRARGGSVRCAVRARRGPCPAGRAATGRAALHDPVVGPDSVSRGDRLRRARGHRSGRALGERRPGGGPPAVRRADRVLCAVVDGGLAPDGRRRERPAGDRRVPRAGAPGCARSSWPSSTIRPTSSASTAPATSSSAGCIATRLPRPRCAAQHGRGRSSSPGGTPDVFVHGEAAEVRAVRRHLLGDRGIRRAGTSISPYWRRTMTDEAWREVKAAWLAEQELDA